jgi:GT2 family glycosyltransferase
MVRQLCDAWLIYVASMGLCAAVLMARQVRRAFELPSFDLNWDRQLGATIAISGLISLAATGNLPAVLFAAAVTVLVSSAVKLHIPQLSFAGTIDTAAGPLAWAVGSVWSVALFAEGGAQGWMIALIIAASVLTAIPVAVSSLEKLARQAILTHGTWRRPMQPLQSHTGRRPKVSIQVPAYAEPPAMLNEVLDALARLDYPDYEVLVCDNNTKDEALWRPVERHCAELNRRIGLERFRFFHVAPLAGAKAGALNWLLPHMAADAELIAVIDADYIAEPDFLSRLTGFFDDPAIGYVQTPHDYRDYATSPYLTACYWEYMPSNKVEMPGINEYGAAFTIGTMCLIRTTALRAAGAWAEWCLTEDSEVSVRLREAGYGGIYLRHTFGRGLIPETFEDYKKQRFRWTAGPVQQLRRYWRLYLPQRWGGSQAMDGWNKLLEVVRGIAPISQIAGICLGFVAAVGLLLSNLNGAVRPIDLPGVAWVALAIGLASGFLRTWQRYQLSGCRRIRDMALGELARLSLTYVQMVGGLAGLSSRPLAWRRTPKFAAGASGLAAFRATLPETLLGVATLAVAIVFFGLTNHIGGDMAVATALGAVSASARFFAAPAMAYLSEKRLSAPSAAATPKLSGGTLQTA